jgi:hypothetical protein
VTDVTISALRGRRMIVAGLSWQTSLLPGARTIGDDRRSPWPGCPGWDRPRTDGSDRGTGSRLRRRLLQGLRQPAGVDYSGLGTRSSPRKPTFSSATVACQRQHRSTRKLKKCERSAHDPTGAQRRPECISRTRADSNPTSSMARSQPRGAARVLAVARTLCKSSYQVSLDELMARRTTSLCPLAVSDSIDQCNPPTLLVLKSPASVPINFYLTPIGFNSLPH